MSEQTEKRTISAYCMANNLFFLYIAVYLLTSSGNIVATTDANYARYEVTRSIIERFDVSIPDGLGIKGVDGRDYSWYGFGMSALATPFYLFGKLTGNPENAVSVMNQLFGAAAATLVFLFANSLGYSRRASVIVSLCYGFGTIAWPLSKQPFDHTVETFFVLLSVYSAYLYSLSKKISLICLSSISLGFAFLTRANSLLVMPSLLLLSLMGYTKTLDLREAGKRVVKDFALFSLLFAPFIAVSLWYNHVRFGSAFVSGFSVLAARTGINFFSGTSFLTGLEGLLISPGKGYFYYSPMAVLFFFSIRSFGRKHQETAACFISIMAVYILFLAKYKYWPGDCAWGPRYLLVVTPFFIIPIAGLIDSNTWQRMSFVRLLISILFAISLIVQIAAISVYFYKYYFYLNFEEKVIFTESKGYGTPAIIVPPPGVYFEWQKSPIAAQFKFIREIAVSEQDYHYSKPENNAAISAIALAYPAMHIFDFWWLYVYFLEGSYHGFLIALLLCIFAIHVSRKVYIYST